MDNSIWTTLGIDPTADERAIKRAYAARLKLTSPEADAAGYMELREAYEYAKQHARLLQFEHTLEMQESDAASADAQVATPLPAEQAKAIAPAEARATSPQQQAMDVLHDLLAKWDFAGFLRSLDATLAADIFATLDQQYVFIGEVALLLHEFQPLDPQWCGKVAERLGAREHENIFEGDHRYWHAYERLLSSYHALRVTEASVHVSANAELAAAPGYLHVYHVLTAPFDSERLSALTRSRTYQRLAEQIMEQAKGDSSSRIPLENRTWWERTAMAGQHRPTTEPAAPPVVVQQTSRRVPYWMVFIGIVTLIRVFSAVTSDGTDRAPTVFNLSALEILQARMDFALQRYGLDLSRLSSSCDPETRIELLARLNAEFAPRDIAGTTDHTIYFDPTTATLAAKCKAVVPKTRHRASFEILDFDSDRRISQAEADADAHIASQFSYLDADDDGYLSRTEFTQRQVPRLAPDLDLR